MHGRRISDEGSLLPLPFAPGLLAACNYRGFNGEMPKGPLEFRIDGKLDKDHVSTVKRWLSLLLLFGAMLGLLAQEAAFASAPAMPMPMASDTSVSAPAMSAECAEMMGIDTSTEKSQDKKPCKGLTLDCIAKMGCALPLAIATPTAMPAASDHRAAPTDRLPVSRLRGRSYGPEPDPPLFLA